MAPRTRRRAAFAIASVIVLLAAWWLLDSYFRACGDCGNPLP